MDLLLVWLVSGVIIAILANSRGRSALGWFLLTLVVSPFLTIILILVLPTKNRAPCPFCAEPIRHEARICPHCHGHLAPMDRSWKRAADVDPYVAQGLNKDMT